MYDDVIYKEKFIWNRVKSEKNKKDHKISFETAALAFDDPLAVVVYDFENSYSEDRYNLTGFGMFHPDPLTVSFTPRMELTRIFSAGKADEKEKEEYFENARRIIG